MQETLFPGSPIPGSRRSPREMAIHSSILAWRIPWTEDPGELQLPGASVRNPAHGNGHEEGNLTKCKGMIRLQGSPLEFPEHPPLKIRVCLLYCVMLSTYSSDINRGLSPHHLFLEKVNSELLDYKSPGHNTSVSIQKPLWWLSSLLQDSYSCACDCLRPPDH